jgi:hypothetical protein
VGEGALGHGGAGKSQHQDGKKADGLTQHFGLLDWDKLLSGTEAIFALPDYYAELTCSRARLTELGS